ncbi:MAG: antibiotic biosynthesis monooxygenase [Halioglobus sp.]
MNKVTLRGYILFPGADITAVERALPAHIEATLSERGCIAFEVSPHSDDPRRYNVFEQFESREAFEFHQKRVANSEWARVTASAERHYEVTEG